MRAFGLVIIAVVSFAVSLAAYFPLGVALNWASLDEAGIKHGGAQGTIWRGALFDVEIDGAPLGQISFNALPRQYRGGLLPVHFEVAGPGLSASGAAVVGLGAEMRVRDTVLDVDLQRSPMVHPALQAGPARLSVTIEEAAFGEEGCLEVKGWAVSNVLEVGFERWRWRGPQLEGPVSCRDGSVHVSLEGAQGAERVRADFTLGRGGVQQFSADVETADPGVTFALISLDFTLSEDGAVLSRAYP